MTISPILASPIRSIAFKESEKPDGNVKKEEKCKKIDKKVVASTLAGTATGIVTAISILAMIQKKNSNNSFIKQIFQNKYGAKEVILLGGSSILGGLIGGCASDKKGSKKSKVREAFQQFIGNFVIPVSMLAGATALFEKYKKKIPDITKLSAKANSNLKKVYGIVVTLGTLAIGTKAGNEIMEKVNNKIFHEKKKRNLNAKDFTASFDDICYSMPFMFKNPTLNSVVSKTLPLVFLIPGYETGTKQ